uniref:Uncharacterized protein LOC100177349 n=1 Tax=Phallusia mammillata TaxID=59560 RepID=A0A6F9DHJ2_9ASCI|nr:uncharacterized protein LOC100177349 [Phallusia mammillata]
MGSKMSSSMSCVKCSSHDSKRFKHRSRRRSRSNRYNYEESVYETIAPPMVYMNRVDQHQVRIEPIRTFSQRCSRPSLPLPNIRDERQYGNTHSLRPPEPQDHRIFIGTSTVSKERLGVSDRTTPREDPSKCASSSIEILDCPEMSTISMRSAPSIVISSRRGSAQGNSGNDAHHTSGGMQMTDDDLYPVRTTHEDATMSTLHVPPNSVNSQFISGITPLESLQEVDCSDNASNDSVFVREQRVGYYECDTEYLAHYQGQFLNNNSLLPCVVNEDGTRQTLSPSLRPDVSDGPGFDSDFGASAGVEMRIVSSDYSGINSSHFMKTKGDNTSSVKLKKRNAFRSNRPSPRAQLAEATFQNNTTGRGKSPKRKPAFVLNAFSRHTPLARLTPRRRPATISGPERSALHITMEWDPYELGYGSSHWMEYFIPGVAYPPQPLLCKEQYWV